MNDLKSKKNIREKIGDIFQIKLDENTYAYGQVISKAECAFFDFFSNTETVDLDQIINSKVLFRLTVDGYVIRDGFWKIIGRQSINDELKVKVKLFTYDHHKNEYTIWSNEGQRKATPEEIYNLESFSSWAHKSVEQRIKDYIAGRPNYDVEYARQEHKGKFPDAVTFYKQYGYDFKFDDEENDEK